MDSIDDLLTDLLARPDCTWRTGLEELCRAHPAQAERLRRRFGHLESCGIATPSSVAPLAATAPPQTIGPYRLLRRLGSGGMGTVWLANDETMNREVAIKMIRPERLWMPQARERFQREIAAIARLRHPGCVQIHQVGAADGASDGAPYFAMEFLAGASCERIVAALRERATARSPSTLLGSDLAAVLREGGQQVDSGNTEFFGGRWPQVAVRIALAAAEALAHAHARGVVHRDLKPGNLMVTPDGRVVLIDFGLAIADGASNLTREGSQLGSVPYMAPEQLRPGTTPIDARTDIYALGVCLYELLALQPPFALRDELHLRAAILAGEAPPLRDQNAAVDRKLATVVAHAMHVAPEHRYPSALAFAADLVAVTEDRPISVEREPLGYRLRRQVRRHPALMTAAALLLLGLLLVPTAITFGIAGERDRAVVAEREAARREYMANIAAAGAALQIGNARVATLHLDACPEPLRGFEWDHLHLALDSSLWQVRLGTGAVTALATSPDDKTLAAADQAGQLVLLATTDGSRLRSFDLPADAIVDKLVFTTTGDELLSVDADQTLRVHEVASGRLLRQRTPSSRGEHVYVPPHSDRIVAIDADAHASVVGLHSLAVEHRVALTPRGWPGAAGVHVTADHVVGLFHGHMTAWSLHDGSVDLEQSSAPGRSPSPVHALDTPLRIVAIDGESIGISQGKAGAIAWRPLSGRRATTALLFRSERHLIVPTETGEILIGAADRADWQSLLGHRSAVRAASQVGSLGAFATGDADGIVRMWGCNTNNHGVDLAGEGYGTGLAATADGRLFLGGLSGRLTAVDPATGSVAWTRQLDHWVTAVVALERHGLVASCVSNRLQLWSLDGEARGEIRLPDGTFRRFATSPDGAYLAAASSDGTLVAVDVAARTASRRARTRGRATGIHVDRAGRMFVSGLEGIFQSTLGPDPLVHHISTAECRSMACTDAAIYACERGVDGAWLLVERDPAGATRRRERSVGAVLTALRALDSQVLLAGSETGDIVFFDRQTLQPILSQRRFQGEIYELAIAPDGAWVAANGTGAGPQILWQRAPSPATAAQRQRIGDLRDRIQARIRDQVWTPSIGAELDQDPELDAEARAAAKALLGPPSRWAIGTNALHEAVTPRPSATSLARLGVLLPQLQAAAAANVDPHGNLVATALAVLSARLGHAEAALQASTTVVDLRNEEQRLQLLPPLLFARCLALRQLGDHAAAVRERDQLATMIAQGGKHEPYTPILLRELDEH